GELTSRQKHCQLPTSNFQLPTSHQWHTVHGARLTALHNNLTTRNPNAKTRPDAKTNTKTTRRGQPLISNLQSLFPPRSHFSPNNLHLPIVFAYIVSYTPMRIRYERPNRRLAGHARPHDSEDARGPRTTPWVWDCPAHRADERQPAPRALRHAVRVTAQTGAG